ncbi:hypothetical protein KEM54_001381 [Ascosphaera aggregata]|nr:hypothetical protein KEM54_001381 [Ascosphaera aggregata]
MARLNEETRSHALKVVLRLAADEAIMGLSAIYLQIQGTIGSLTSHSTDAAFTEIATWLFKTVPNPEFQSLILRCIPSLDRRTARFRCRLASAFLYNDDKCLAEPFETLLNIPKIVRFLERRFDVTRLKLQQQQRDEENGDSNSSDIDETVNYYELAALASIVNIAIDNARSTSEPFSSKEEETRFNKQVNDLAGIIKRIFSNIQDSGASHLKRLEAKERLQMLYYRVLYGVRTHEIKKKSAFVMKSREGGDSDLMAKFLGKKT